MRESGLRLHWQWTRARCRQGRISIACLRPDAWIDVARLTVGAAQLTSMLKPRRWRAWCQPSAYKTSGFQAFPVVHAHRIDILSYCLRVAGRQDWGSQGVRQGGSSTMPSTKKPRTCQGLLLIQ